VPRVCREISRSTIVDVIEFTAQDAELLSASRKLRAVVWNAQAHVGHDIFPTDGWADSHDDHAIHFAIRTGSGEVIAAARLCIHSFMRDFPDYEDIENLLPQLQPLKLQPPIGMMNRLVVHPHHQGKGLAKLLDIVRLQKAAEVGCQSMLVEVPEYRRKAVESIGFNYVGSAVDQSPIKEAGIPFFLYAKPIAQAGEELSSDHI
jgi:GNAT superfamily N-acetyltransferase